MPAGRAARRLRWALLLAGVAVVALVVFTGYQALRAKDALQSVAADFETLGDELTSGDRAGAQATLADVQEHATSAQHNIHGPGWWLTSRMPGVGRNVIAVRSVADVVDELAAEVLPPVVEATATLRPANLRPVDGAIDLEPIVRVAPTVVAANVRLQDQSERLARLRTAGLAPQIAAPLSQVKRELAHAAELSDRAARAVQLLPPMLGVDGRRTYLLLFQNNAEVRATGGIPGSFAVVTADHGRISMGRQGDAATIGRFEEPPIPLTADERELFGANMGRYPQDVNFTPDFPRSAQLIRAMWNVRHGLQVDGVLSTDPVALSHLLDGTGPVPIAGARTLTADNAVDLLLSDVYAEIEDPQLQNDFFSSVAGQVFEALASGQGDPEAVLDGLTRGASERRLLIWSSDAAEQRLLAPTKLGGVLPVEPDPHPRVGVFLNDGTGAKMDYYLDYRTTLKARSCADERQKLRLRLTMASSAPSDGSSLPDYVVGGAETSVSGVPRGTIRTSVYLYAPVDGSVERVLIDGEEVELNTLEHDGRRLVATTLDLAPGQQHRVSVEMVSGSGQTLDPVLRVTPGANGPGAGEVSGSACS